MADTTSPQGLVARCRPIPQVSLADAAAKTDPAAVLVLDHVEDPRNVGAIARSAVAAGVRSMVFSGRRSAPLEGTAFKAAAGALEHMAITEVSSIPAALEDLRKAGLWIVGLDGGGDQSLFGLGLLTEPVAVVVGAEGGGLSRLVADRCDVLARIPIDADDREPERLGGGRVGGIRGRPGPPGLTGAGCRSRTDDHLFTRQELYR